MTHLCMLVIAIGLVLMFSQEIWIKKRRPVKWSPFFKKNGDITTAVTRAFFFDDRYKVQTRVLKFNLGAYSSNIGAIKFSERVECTL